jgi:hypothetical protein
MIEERRQLSRRSCCETSSDAMRFKQLLMMRCKQLLIEPDCHDIRKRRVAKLKAGPRRTRPRGHAVSRHGKIVFWYGFVRNRGLERTGADGDGVLKLIVFPGGRGLCKAQGSTSFLETERIKYAIG